MKWTYSKYRATLNCDGEFFALVTPGAGQALSPSDVQKLLFDLNWGATESVMREFRPKPWDGPKPFGATGEYTAKEKAWIKTWFPSSVAVALIRDDTLPLTAELVREIVKHFRDQGMSTDKVKGQKIVAVAKLLLRQKGEAKKPRKFSLKEQLAAAPSDFAEAVIKHAYGQSKRK